MGSRPSLIVGDVSLTRIVESEGPLLTPAEIFPDSTPAIIEEECHWLAPRFHDPAAGRLVIAIQSFLLKTRHDFPAPTAGFIERERGGFRFRYDEE